MYQIFVVEDELLIRQSIRTMIENLSGPYTCCGEASDGEMALSMMQDLMPDILLTDIRMPFLDGFELVKHVKTMAPWMKIVIISGFDDFSYAQKAIALGVDLYLLKPLRPQQLEEAISELARQIEKEKKEDRLPGGYDQDELHSALHQHFMQKLLGGGAQMGMLLEQARSLALDVIHPCYQLVLLSFDGLDASVSRSAFRQRLRQLMAEAQLSLFSLNEYDQLTVVLTGTDADTLNESAYRMIASLRHRLTEICPLITAVVGECVQRMSAIADAYKTAKTTLRRASSLAAGQVIRVDDTAQVTEEMLSFSSPFGEAFQRRLLSASEEEVPALVAECMAGEEAQGLNSALMRYTALIDVVKLAVALMKQEGGGEEKEMLAELSRQHDLFAAAETLEGFRKMAGEILGKAVGMRQQAQGMLRANPSIQRAIAYVEENFCDPNLSLQSVAKHVGMSSAYFSTVFSQTTKTPFISYLTALRMEKAKQLLIQTDRKLASIAMEIGYNEPNYFSHVFRKTEGITPKEYRMRHGKNQ